MYKSGDVVLNRRGDVVTLYRDSHDSFLYRTKEDKLYYVSMLGYALNNKSGDFDDFDIVGYAKMTPKSTYSHLLDSYPDNEIGNAMEKLAEHLYGEDMKNISNRGIDWSNFSKDVFHHIETYTIPQYGDAPDDMLSNESPEYLMKQVQKYLNRFGKNKRDSQELLDFMKMTHCIQIAYSKLKEEKGGD